MATEYPNEEELRYRIVNQLQRRGPNDKVCCLWQGYLAALLEWGYIQLPVYNALIALLPQSGVVELYELFADEAFQRPQADVGANA